MLFRSRYRGHLYNWYDTRSLAPLPPAYISTVDSANLAGYLLTLRAGVTELAGHAPLVGVSCLDGVGDALALCEEEIERAVATGDHAGFRRRWRNESSGLRTLMAMRPATLAEWMSLLALIREHLSTLGLEVEGLMTIPPMTGDARRSFATLADLGARLGLRQLSMGMTDDFEVAIEEGSTMVRVGRALFGAREGA